ncbi:hypothetical protein ACVWXL_008306 [Bradyrhizobium sp. GM22.5]
MRGRAGGAALRVGSRQGRRRNPLKIPNALKSNPWELKSDSFDIESLKNESLKTHESLKYGLSKISALPPVPYGGAASGRAVTACPGWAGGQARIGRINRRARSKIITQSLEERVPDLSQPCSSHSRMAPVSCSTEIAQPRSVRIAGHLSLNISIGISLRPRTNPCRPTAFRAANTDQGFGIRGAVACPRVPSRKPRAASAGASISPLATILSAPSRSGRCSSLASARGARIQTSYSSAAVRIAGIASGWTRPTSAFGSQVRTGVGVWTSAPSASVN